MPPFQSWFEELRSQPLFLPLVIAIGVIVWLQRKEIRALLYAWWPFQRTERAYLDALVKIHSRTPALFRGTTDYQELKLMEAFSPLTLSADGAAGTRVRNTPNDDDDDDDDDKMRVMRDRSGWFGRILYPLRTWWRDRTRCTHKAGTPGAEVWNHPRLLIKGKPGSGKTTLLQFMVLITAREYGRSLAVPRENRVRAVYGWPTCPFPISIRLRDINADTKDLLDFYAQQLRDDPRMRDLRDCNRAFFDKRLRRGGCLVLFDGFDELRNADVRVKVAAMIDALPASPKKRPNYFVVTSRFVGIEGQLDGCGFVRRKIDDLSTKQAEQFIHTRYQAIALHEKNAHQNGDLHWDPNKQAQDLIRRLPNNPSLLKLSTNPLLLSLTVALHFNYRGQGLPLPERRYQLYAEAVRLMSDTWEARRWGNVEQAYTITYEGRLHLLQELAWIMFDLHAGAQEEDAHAVIPETEAIQKFSNLLVEFSDFATGLPAEQRKQLAGKEAQGWLDGIGQRGNILQRSSRTSPHHPGDLIEFAHLTFQEYLAACAAERTEQETRLKRIIANWKVDAWHQVLLLYAASADANPIVTHLYQQPDPQAALLAGEVLLERPVKLSPALHAQTCQRLVSLAFEAADATQEQAEAALRMLEELQALSERAVVLRGIESAPFPTIRARAIELAAGRAVRTFSPAKPAALPADLPPILERISTHERHALPRVTAMFLLQEARPALPLEPELCHIPAGPFLMGSSPDDRLADSDERPQHRLELPDFWLARYPVTNAQFRPFVESDGYTNRRYWTPVGWQWCQKEKIRQPGWWDDPKWNAAHQPVVGVSWFEAVAYCNWLSAATGHPFRLPSEAEWEKAARGPEGRIWPWGNTWQVDACNHKGLGWERTTPVGCFPNGRSYYDLHDMAGNVWEWCASKWRKSYPYQIEDEWSDAYLDGDHGRMFRGGSWYNGQSNVRGAYRNYDFPRYRYYYYFGLRVASCSSRPHPES